jgi:hypothetical protein
MDQILTKFNILIEEFIVKMLNAFPDEQKLRTYYNAFKISKLYSKQLPIQIFMGGCLDFEQQIKTRDAEFFINRKTFVDKCVRASSFSNDIGLRDRWESTPEITKKSIWDYIQTLYVLGEMYIKKDQGVVDKINQVYDSMSISEMKRFENDSVTQFSEDFTQKIK